MTKLYLEIIMEMEQQMLGYLEKIQVCGQFGG